MFASLLSLILIGQCVGGSCPTPILPSAPLAVLPAVQAPPREYAWREIVHDGLTFRVWGYAAPDGSITWEPGMPGNRRAWDAARAKAMSGVLDMRPSKPPPPRQEAGPIRNFGLAPERMGLHRDEYTAGSDEARTFVAEARQEADDAARFHVTVIGTIDDCAPVVRDIRTNPAFDSVRDRLMVQDYRPGDWAVDPKLGYRTDGRPTILVQQARGASDPKGGRVVYRAMDYSGGPAGLAEAIRQADPSYKPDLDPGPATGPSGSCPLGFNSSHWPAVLVAGLVLGLVALRPAPSKDSRP